MDKRITLRFSGPGSFPPFIPVTPAGTELADVEVRDGSPTGPLLTTVRLKATGDTSVYQDFSAPLDFAGSKRLYLVFKQTPRRAGHPVHRLGQPQLGLVLRGRIGIKP